MGYGHGWFDGFHVLGILAWGLASMVVLAVVVAILVLLVRYLLVGTRAHKLYIANNSPVVDDEPVVAEPIVPKRTPKAPPAV